MHSKTEIEVCNEVWMLLENLLHFSRSVPLVDNINGEVQGTIHRRGPSVSSASSEDVSINRIAEEDNNSGSDSSNAVPPSSASGGWGRGWGLQGVDWFICS